MRKLDFKRVLFLVHRVTLAKQAKKSFEKFFDKVGELIDTIEFDYPIFHLSMDCFWAEVTKGHLELKEAEAAKWLTRDRLGSVAWLPADVTLIDKIRRYMK